MKPARIYESPPKDDFGAEARVFPGAFESSETAHLSVTENKYQKFIQEVLLYLVTWYGWNKNYVRIVDHIIMSGLLISFAGMLSALANVYHDGAEGSIYSGTSKSMSVVTVAVALVCAILFIAYHGIFLSRGLKKKDDQAVGRQLANEDDQAVGESLSGQLGGEQGNTYENPPTDDSSAEAGVPGQRVIITNLKATNVAAGLRRIPAGFYVSVSIGNDH
ncbi:hypothetical protein HYDPIDRAFT_34533 [Hydnomerulius pinastri MD-312]|uniref:Uncharacterized protein n=1 Tax=Hydnomerulius pinastri MD-312 TaxID=994086 RepID=A0A0C9W5X6_9AGAM|nr:hypothetical protein HYDPIDRAFT_34533 [Hydnomerulius pinastri MD-312]